MSTKPAREQARKDRTDRVCGIVEKGADEWTSGRRDDGGKKGGNKGSKGSKHDWYGDKDKGGTGNKGKGKGKGKGKIETRYCYGCGIDEEDDQGSSWESEVELEKAEELGLAEDDEDEQASGGLNHQVSRKAGGVQWTWKNVIVVVDSGAAENVTCSPKYRLKKHRGPKKWERIQGTRRRAH